MRAVLAAVIMALVATPVRAQQQMPQYGQVDKEKTNSEKAADRAAADAYRRSLGVIPDQGPTDPWGNVRGNAAPKPAPGKSAEAKSAKAKSAKAGSAEAKPQ